MVLNEPEELIIESVIIQQMQPFMGGHLAKLVLGIESLCTTAQIDMGVLLFNRCNFSFTVCIQASFFVRSADQPCEQSSVRTPFVAFGCRKAMDSPSAPLRGCASINWKPAVCASCNAPATSGTAKAI